MDTGVAYAAVPLRTHLVREGEDVVELVRRYAGRIAEPGDVVAISESAVAVSQGRAVLSRSVRPGALARFLCCFPQKHGSLATPQAMQLAINEAGALRVFVAAVIGGIGKALGVRGLFYRVAGSGLAAIDDIAGTLYPFDEHVVLGPKDGQSLVEAIRDRTGLEAAIVDVNDIRRVDFIAATRGVNRREVARALESNPMGNDDEQTPVVVLKKVTQGPPG